MMFESIDVVCEHLIDWVAEKRKKKRFFTQKETWFCIIPCEMVDFKKFWSSNLLDPSLTFLICLNVFWYFESETPILNDSFFFSCENFETVTFRHRRSWLMIWLLRCCKCMWNDVWIVWKWLDDSLNLGKKISNRHLLNFFGNL